MPVKNQPDHLAVDNLTHLLEEGEIELEGQFMLGSNYTFLVDVKLEGREMPAVYKPKCGERPLWDFPEASLAGREVAAYLVSEALGWGIVPVTVLCDGPYGPGSLQQFIDADLQRHYFTLQPVERLRLRPVALFDLLVNNADRKGSHVLLEKRTEKFYAIDHGLCFHTEDKLRTVIWDFAGENIPEELLNDLYNLSKMLAVSLRPQLAAYLLADEIEAFNLRLQKLITQPVFPMPTAGRRSFPYPPF